MFRAVRAWPYSGLGWVGYLLCGAVYPFMDGARDKSFWLALLLAPVWGICIVMAHRRSLAEKGLGLGGFIMLNTFLALPTVIAAYWAGRLIG